MKVLNLQCAQEHSFEGWFASEDDYLSQLERKLVSCPLCGDSDIKKKLSAPRLNLRSAREERPDTPLVEPAKAVAAPLEIAEAKLHAQWLTAMRQVIANTEDVGESFADQARAMHHGEAETRNIRGSTSAEVARELVDEGIEVMLLPMVPALKETLQ